MRRHLVRDARANVVGTATLNAVDSLVTLKEGGTSLIVHADPDDETTDQAGNSGRRRVACGVIER
jgi:superoxide dismutase, Cu-Zn family